MRFRHAPTPTLDIAGRSPARQAAPRPQAFRCRQKSAAPALRAGLQNRRINVEAPGRGADGHAGGPLRSRMAACLHARTESGKTPCAFPDSQQRNPARRRRAKRSGAERRSARPAPERRAAPAESSVVSTPASARRVLDVACAWNRAQIFFKIVQNGETGRKSVP